MQTDGGRVAADMQSADTCSLCHTKAASLLQRHRDPKVMVENRRLQQQPESSLGGSGFIPVGANAALGSSSDRSALILLLSAKQSVRAGRLSTLPPLDSGRDRRGSPCRDRGEGSPAALLTTPQDRSGADLWFEGCELRRDLDGVVAPLRVAVLHVGVAFVAGVGVVQI